MTHRIAIWAAVSTEAQAAADKVSLEEQVAACRKVAEARGWIETAGTFIVPGESRTRWVNLRDAENAIPALRQMLDSAQHGDYDLLLLYDYNRLRDLLDPVSTTLAYYGVQIFSISQPVEPQPAADYSPYASDASAMMQGLARIISQAQISDLRRKYHVAMPRRITDRGLPIHIPHGYRKPPGQETNRAAVPIQDAELCRYLIHIKDMLLSGQTIRQIIAYLEEHHVPAPRGGAWYPGTVRSILRNPFYAGVVRFGVTQAKLDPRTGRRYRDRTPARSRLVTGPGKHQPLWDITTHQAILKELKVRGKNYRGRKNSQFTSLLVCGICGARMWTYYDGHYGRGEVRVWRCSTREHHVVIKHQEILEIFAARLADDINGLIRKDKPAQHSADANELNDLLAQRARIEDAFQAGLFSLDSFSERVADLDAQIMELESVKLAEEMGQREHNLRLAALRELAGEIGHISQYLASGDPQDTNHLLRMLVKEITVNEDHTLEVDYKV